MHYLSLSRPLGDAAGKLLKAVLEFVLFSDLQLQVSRCPAACQVIAAAGFGTASSLPHRSDL